MAIEFSAFSNCARYSFLSVIRNFPSIEVSGEKYWTLFDSGARNTFVTQKVAERLQVKKNLPKIVKLGGKQKQSLGYAVLETKIEDKPIETFALILDEIGSDDNGKEINILFGALAMQQYSIHLVMEKEELDLSHYPDEYVEF